MSSGPWGDGGNSGNSGNNNNNNSPWGGKNTGGRGGDIPPNVEELVRQGQEKIKRFFPGGGSSKGILILVSLAIALWMATGFYRVQPGQVGVELIFGKLWEETTPGLRYNFPSPVGEVITPEVERARRTDVGFRTGGDFNSRLATQRDVKEESLMLTGDENIVDLDFTVFWRVQPDNVASFLFQIKDPENTIKAASESAMREVVGQTTFDLAVTTGREQIENGTREALQDILNSYNSGIEVERVELQKSDPPSEVIDAFNDVQRARQDRDRLRNEAEAYANSVVPEARGQAEQMIREGEAYRERLIKESEGEAERFLSVYAEYVKAPSITRRRMYLETMGQIFTGADKVVIDQNAEGANGVQPYLPLPELRRNMTANSSNDAGSNADNTTGN